ncbi:hypothetical protein N7474_000812 [Penicillium riverlandense]|uniref:uncharacterized protein n=1 Tax=Penicillium riverlandense TaxID=1903569 RepID=UPI0025477FF5|nr:uncharacterized protein N7474_000812 [Penicillium riverlandense]KAJ5832501.1 hypothetical protein N7474_000812 [Penicillium riverlandense]
MAAVNQNMFDASIAMDRPGGSSLMVLPLNLIAQIVSNVEDTGDLARLCRTCRVLNYMALPQLYRSLTLTSYDRIRYRGEQPEGIGSGSPFTMGLNAVITRPYATLVRSMTLRGDWKEHELEEHARVGRVPDSSMMLNIAVRAAVDRMTGLESFSWELNTKMLDTVYNGLTQLPRLTSLTVRFPSSRHPQPTFVLPPMPHLRCLKITDIDPLCYPDDIATLLWKSKKLRDLRLHWSPRMRIAQEPSVSLHDYFRKSIAAKQPLAVKKMSFSNLYAFHTEEFNIAFDPTTVEDVTFLSGADSSNLVNTFVDSSWPTVVPHRKLKIKSIRMDAISKRNSEFLGNFSGLEKLYFVNMTSDSSDYLNSPRPGMGPASSALTPPVSENPGAANGTAGNSPTAMASPASQTNLQLNIRDSYIANITTNHGASLRHLLLSSRWPLSTKMIARLVHSCPNLEQLGLATEFSSMESLGLLVPFLRKLVALRLLIPAGSAAPQSGASNTTMLRTYNTQRIQETFPSHLSKVAMELMNNAKSMADVVDIDDRILMEMMSYDMANEQVFENLKIVGLGWKAFELREFYKTPPPPPPENEPDSNAAGDQSAEATNGSPSPGNDPKSAGPEQHTAPQPQDTTSGNTNTNPIAPKSPAAVSSSQPTSYSNHPPSTLGKRPRDDDESNESNENSMAQRSNSETDEPRQPRFQIHGCLSHIITTDGYIRRRRLRRVGWDVLKHWEIWGLDSQEI